jgi:hypothetical protein
MRKKKMWHRRKSYDIDDFYWFLQKAKTMKYNYYIQVFGRDGEGMDGVRNSVIWQDQEYCFIDRFRMDHCMSGQELVRYGEEPIFIINYFGEKVGDAKNLKNAHILELLKLALIVVYENWGVNGFVTHEKDGYRYYIESMKESGMQNGKGHIEFEKECIYQYSFYGGLLRT